MRHIVGLGRVGGALANALPEATGHSGRNFNGSVGAGDVVLLTVPDRAIAEVAARISPPEAVVLHCAGGVGLSALGDGSRGVFYPMVSFRKPVDWAGVPVFAEASDDLARSAITELAADLGCAGVTWMDSAQRAKLHLGAVFANNFSNHVVALLQEYCAHAGLDSALYASMIQDTVADATAGNARSLQTGPALRGDRDVLDAHVAQLPEDLRPVYEALSASIERLAR